MCKKNVAKGDALCVYHLSTSEMFWSAQKQQQAVYLIYYLYSILQSLYFSQHHNIKCIELRLAFVALSLHCQITSFASEVIPAV